MAAARNASRNGRQRSQDPAESLINLSNERLTGLFRWTLLIFAVILNNLNPAAGYNQLRINGILAAWGVVCLSTVLLLFLHRRPGKAFSYATTGVDMLVATMITWASGGYTSPFAALFFLVITVSALRFGAVGSVLCAIVVALLYLTAGAVAPLQEGTYLTTVTNERIVILQRMFLFVVVAVLGSVMARAVSAHQESMALTEDEMAWMRRHPQIGADIIGPVEGLHHVAPLIRHHHEKWDGTGYPKGMKGEEIPLGSRIISVADAFEAMVADRIYRPSLGLAKTLEEIKTGRGTHFDP